MSRYFEIIQPGTKSRPERQRLPLVIGGSESAHIRLSGTDSDVCYVGEDHGHLFLQPATDHEEIFHNNERITSSVWIKSGDITRIGNQIIHYSISGDLVTITVQEAAPETLQVSGTWPPEPAAAEPMPARPLPRVSSTNRHGKTLPMWARITLPLLVILTAAAALLAAAQSFELRITPEPDTISFSLFPPVVKAGGRYLALAGTYHLRAEKEGYRPLDEHISVGKGMTKFSFTMKPMPGLADFTTTPTDGAKIVVDGVSLGTSPLLGVSLEAGPHTVRVDIPRYRLVNEKIMIQGRGKRQHFSFQLTPAWGTAAISSDPEGAAILVDGNDSKRLTPAEIEMDEGNHRITLRKDGYRPESVSVTIMAGKHAEIPVVRLRPAPARLNITSTPSGALIAIDGVYMGKTPLQCQIEPHDTHRITATAPGHVEATKKVKLRPGDTEAMDFKLSGQYGTVFITTEPSEAILLIDGKVQNKNSGKFTLLAVHHTIEARLKGYTPQKKRIAVHMGSTQSLDFRLTAGGLRGAATLHPPDLVLIQPGSFVMGSSRREQGRRTNEVRRDIILTRPFYISAKEVTNSQFRMFRPNHSSGSFAGQSLNGGSQPVVNVSWDDAARYCNFLSERQGLPPFYTEKDNRMVAAPGRGTGYRLPTEAEWAYAARFVKQDKPAKYPWTGTFPPPDNSGNFADESARGLLPVIIDNYHDSFAVSAPPGSFKPNAAGLFDMGGNVAEWCHDYYSPTAPHGPEKDPSGPAQGTHHVVRGSSWQDSSMTELRLCYRGFSRKPSDYLGFRIARYAR